MAVQHSNSDRVSSSEVVPPNLCAARNALRDEQRRLLPGSPGWNAVRALIRDIEVLATRSGSEGLNLCSELRVTAGTSRTRGASHERLRVRAKPLASLHEFARSILERRRISKYDVQALKERLKDGISSREEADLLITLDMDVESVHCSWPAFFISALTEFALWQPGRSACIDDERSSWLVEALNGRQATGRARRVLAAIAGEAQPFGSATLPAQ
jgi:hypothetical protein